MPEPMDTSWRYKRDDIADLRAKVRYYVWLRDNSQQHRESEGVRQHREKWRKLLKGAPALELPVTGEETREELLRRVVDSPDVSPDLSLQASLNELRRDGRMGNLKVKDTLDQLGALVDEKQPGFVRDYVTNYLPGGASAIGAEAMLGKRLPGVGSTASPLVAELVRQLRGEGGWTYAKDLDKRYREAKDKGYAELGGTNQWGPFQQTLDDWYASTLANRREELASLHEPQNTTTSLTSRNGAIHLLRGMPWFEKGRENLLGANPSENRTALVNAGERVFSDTVGDPMSWFAFRNALRAAKWSPEAVAARRASHALTAARSTAKAAPTAANVARVASKETAALAARKLNPGAFTRFAKSIPALNVALDLGLGLARNAGSEDTANAYRHQGAGAALYSTVGGYINDAATAGEARANKLREDMRAGRNPYGFIGLAADAVSGSSLPETIVATTELGGDTVRQGVAQGLGALTALAPMNNKGWTENWANNQHVFNKAIEGTDRKLDEAWATVGKQDRNSGWDRAKQYRALYSRFATGPWKPFQDIYKANSEANAMLEDHAQQNARQAEIRERAFRRSRLTAADDRADMQKRLEADPGVLPASIVYRAPEAPAKKDTTP